jgi:hypothetical protein
MDDVASITKTTVPDIAPVGDLPVGDLAAATLLRSEDFVPFAVDCFARAVRNAVADEAAAIMRTKNGA